MKIIIPFRVMALLLSIGLVLSAPASLLAGELHDEVRGGDLEAVKKLVESGEDLNSLDENGFTPLLVAAWADRENVAKYLLAKGADPTFKSKTGYALFPIIVGKGWVDVANYLLSKGNISRSEMDRALWTSASRGYDGLVKVLIRHGGNPNGNLPNPPIRAALSGGHLKTVKLLLQSGAQLNPNEPEDAPPIKQALASRYYEIAEFLLAEGARVDSDALRLAIKSGYLDLADIILKRGASLEGVEENFLGYVRKGELEKVRFLITHGADVEDIRTREGYNALMVASAAGNLNMVRLLINSGAHIGSKVTPPPNIHSVDMNGTALTLAASSGSEEVVDLLLSSGADVNASTYAKGDTPLRRAAGKGHYDVVTRLLVAGADVNVMDFLGESPLTSSLKAKAWKVADKLIEVGADISIINRKGLLHSALSQNDAEMVEYLFSKKVDVNAQVEGTLPLIIAARAGNIPWVRTLLRKGANPDPVNEGGTTALLMALEYGAQPSGMRLPPRQVERSVLNRKETAKVLLEAGADINRKDNTGRTALDYAFRDDEKEMREFLLANGARNLTGWLDYAAASLKTWRGVVVEKSTGRPVAGAVVVRSWEKRIETFMGSGQEFLGYREGISAKDGSFSVPSLTHSRIPSITIEHGQPVSSKVVDAGSFVYRPGYKISHFDKTSNMVELERLPPDRELRKAELAEMRGVAGEKALRLLSSLVSDEKDFLRLTSPDEYRRAPLDHVKRRKFTGKPEKKAADEPIDVEVTSGSGAGVAVSPDQVKAVKDRREKPPETTTAEKPKPVRIKETDPPELLRRALGSAKYTPLERAKAAALLGSSHTPVDVDALAVSLLDVSPVSDEACKALAQEGVLAVETLIHIVDNDGDAEQARNRIQAWFPGVELSSYGIDEKRFQARRLAVKALGMIGDERGMRSLISILRSPKSHHSQLVHEAIKALGNFKTREVSNILVEFAQNPPPFGGYEKTVFNTLLGMGEPAVMAVSARLKAIDLSKRPIDLNFCKAAISFLGETTDPRSEQVLVDLTSAQTSFLRQMARDSLSKKGDPRAVPPVMAAWRGDDSAALREATSGIVQLGPLAVEALRGALADALPKNRMRAAWALGWINDPSVVDDLAKLREDEVFEVRWIAVESLGRLENPAAVNAIREFCSEEATGLRTVAEAFLKAKNAGGCK